MSFWITPQYTYPAFLIAASIEMLYLACVPRKMLEREQPHLGIQFLKGLGSSIHGIVFFILVLQWWCIIHCLFFMRHDLIINLLPMILTAMLTIVSIAKIMKNVTIHKVINHAVAVIMIMVALSVSTIDLIQVFMVRSLIVLLSILLVLGITRAVAPRKFKDFLGKTLYKNKKMYCWFYQGWIVVLILVVAMADMLLQFDSVSLLLPRNLFGWT
ncbi:hypothetical protein GF325_18930 [Candidatus Bathyarchaeota archaeon]|nr:hypothetical protein [Candidatus Bathyarchaeota archaeon]